MFQKINDIIVSIDNVLWGLPLIILIMGCGIILTVRTRGVQFRKLGTALKFAVKNEEEGDGDVSSFGALCTALSATIGTGNIVGVATAVAAGGPGALFWMEIAAILGMATKYTEGLLALKYRTFDKDGKALGGPFYYIENGMGSKWKWLAKVFAVCGVLAGLMGIGTITQINGITSAANSFFSDFSDKTISIFGNDYTIVTIIAGLIVTICAALVIIGGLKKITQVSEIIVPFMAILYILCVLILILTNLSKVPAAIVEIVKGAFGVDAMAGGALGTMMIAMQKGVSRGIFSNEAGLGSAPIAAAAAKTKDPVRQGLVTMTGTFIDTICICTMTGLAVVISGAWSDTSIEGVEITERAFSECLPFPAKVSSFLLMICLVFFAFTTILGWSYYSERCLAYLTNGGEKSAKIFRVIYIIAVFVGPYMTVDAVWNMADVFNGFMAIPNVIALVALSGAAAKDTKEFLRLSKDEKKAKQLKIDS